MTEAKLAWGDEAKIDGLLISGSWVDIEPGTFAAPHDLFSCRIRSGADVRGRVSAVQAVRAPHE